MSDKPVTASEARLELFLAWCALDSLKARCANVAPEAPGLFVQPISESLADIEAALKTRERLRQAAEPRWEGGADRKNPHRKVLTSTIDTCIKYLLQKVHDKP